MSRRAFTLVELLVAIGVIATLLGLLAPALRSAREAARAVGCLSNARELQMANDAHARDHHERYVAGAKDSRSNLNRWHGARDRTREPFDPARGPLTPYLHNASMSEAVRACPTFAPVVRALEETGQGFERGAGGYGYNNAFVGTTRRETAPGVWVVERDDGARRAGFASPARTVSFADAAYAGGGPATGGLIEYAFVEPRFWPDGPGFRPDPSVHFRHNGASSVAWLDGHASHEARTHSVDGWATTVSAREAGLGWFGDADDNRLFDYD